MRSWNSVKVRSDRGERKMTGRTVCGVLLVWMAGFALPGTAAEHAKGEAFLELCRTKARAGDSMSVRGRDGWLFLRTELSHLGKGEFWGAAAQKANPDSREGTRDPLAAIVAYNNSAKAAGIGLLFVPIPPKAVVYPDMLVEGYKATPRLDVHHQAFYKLLREKGVDVLDVTPLLIEGRKATQVYCRTDSHYSPQGLKIVAATVAAKVKKMDWYAKAAKSDYTVTRREATVTGDLLRCYTGADKPAPERLQLEVIAPAQELQPVESVSSPITVLADSHGLIFHSGEDMLAKDAGVADHLAHQTRLPVDLIGTCGSGATPTRISFYRAAKRDPAYIGRKKLIIWLLTAREFTESSWNAKVPATPK